jgi:outer membrane protein, heavy metal efflux system
MHPALRNLLLTCLFSDLLLGCANMPYVAKPIDATQSATKLSKKSLSDPEFRTYLIKNGVDEASIPFRSWDINTLTHTALYFHSDLAVAKEKLALAEHSIQLAGLKPSVGVGGSIGRSDRANGDINPMAYSLQIDIPFETTSKRAIKVEEAQQLAEISRLDAAEIAWNLRNQIRLDLINYHQHLRNLEITQREVDIYQQLNAMLQKRLAVGIESGTSLSQYQLMLQKAQVQLRQLSGNTEYLVMKLAADTGLSYATFNSIPITPMSNLEFKAELLEISTSQADILQAEALIHRIDIRRALARYAAAESRLKLEVAKQIPDITLSPSYMFEFGDRIWSLGIGTLLNLLKQQPSFIKQAELLRSIEGAQFEALQESVIMQTYAAHAQYRNAQLNYTAAKESLSAQMKHVQQFNKQFDAGLIDRFQLTQMQLSLQLAEQAANSAQFEMLRQHAQLENTLQRPLTDLVSMTQLQSQASTTTP